MSRHNCRLCWNRSQWTQPTGDAQKLEDRTYVSKHGFGHEEWLFNYDWLLDGVKFGHLQPVGASQGRLAGSTLDLNLYTYGPGREILCVGAIEAVRVLELPEAEKVLTEFQRRGWLEEMASDLTRLGIEPAPILEAPPLDTFNVAFEPENVQLEEPLWEIPKNHPRYPKATRYILMKVEGESPGEPPLPQGSETPTKSQLRSYRRPTAGNDVEWRHTRLQNEVHDFLKRRHHSVLYERSFVDLTVCHQDGNILFELKTAPTARACIREGLGQLLEYAHYWNHEQVRQLVVVSRAPITDTDRAYLDTLNTEYGIPVAYWSFNPERRASNQAVYPPHAALF